MRRWILILMAAMVVGVGCSKNEEEAPPPAPAAPPAPVIPEVSGRFELGQSTVRTDFFDTTDSNEGQFYTTEIQADGSSLYVLRHFVAKEKRPETFLEIYELKSAKLTKTIGLTVGRKSLCTPTKFQIEGAKLYMRGVGCIFILNKDSEAIEEERELGWEIKKGLSEEALAIATFGESESLIIEGENIYLPIGYSSAAAISNSPAWNMCKSLRSFPGKKFRCHPIFSSLQIRINGTHLFFLSQLGHKKTAEESHQPDDEGGGLSDDEDSSADNGESEKEKVANSVPQMKLFKKKKDRSGTWAYLGIEPVLPRPYYIMNFFVNGNVLYLLGVDSRRGPMIKKYTMDANGANLTFASEREVDVSDDSAVMVVIHNKIIIGQSDRIISMADF